MDVIDLILDLREYPERLALGFACIEARLNIETVIGFPKDTIYMERVVAGAVGVDDPATGTALEVFLHDVPAIPGQKKHIIVMGHTNCTGLRKCIHRSYGEGQNFSRTFLENAFGNLRNDILKTAQTENWSSHQIEHVMLEQSVRRNYETIKTYTSVQDALAQDKLELHGVILDITTHQMSEMHATTMKFGSPRSLPTQSVSPTLRTTFMNG